MPVHTHSVKDLDRATLSHLGILSTMATRLTAQLRAQGADRAITADPARVALLRLPGQLAGSVSFVRLQRAWEQEPVVCSMHPDMVAELADVDYADMPSAMFHNLAYRNPRILFPVPVPCTSLVDRHGNVTPGGGGEVIGAQISGFRRDVVERAGPDGEPQQVRIKVPCSTHHPDLYEHRVTIFTRVGDSCEISQLDLPTGHAEKFHPLTVVREAAQSEAGGRQEILGLALEELVASFMSRLSPVMDALIYLSSRKMESERAQPRGGKKADRKRRKPGDINPQIFNVGYHRGPELADLRRRWTDYVRTEQGKGRRAPHPRRAHYRDWPMGRRDEQVFVSPTYVGLSLLDEVNVPTIVPVGRTE